LWFFTVLDEQAVSGFFGIQDNLAEQNNRPKIRGNKAVKNVFNRVCILK
jgi:hypothetical protein